MRKRRPSPATAPAAAGPPAVLAIAAHPDDIEFLMAGTLLLLADRGWDLHYFNLATGNCGSAVTPAGPTRRIRRREARAAARLLGATWHPPLVDDAEIFYTDRLIRQVTAVVREVRPTIVLTHSPQDYMEDHMNACRVAVTAAFVRGMPNYFSLPRRPATLQPVTVYHALPHGLRDGLRRRIVPGAFVDVTAVRERKRAALAAHRSQKAWLDATQGMDSYLDAMDDMAREVGRMSRRFAWAEGWRRHSHLGFCPEKADPLREALGAHYLVNRSYERSLG
jgi:LmbE family N-acetylglucosaminyl deacetylase